MKIITRITFQCLIACLCLNLAYSQSQISITADVTQGCSPLTVNFTNTSTIGTSYWWSFGDGPGYSFSGADTNHTFLNPGNYNVTLYAYDAQGNYIGSNYVQITVNSSPTGFYMSATTVCPGDNVGFSYAQSTSYNWNFGDGDTASGQWTNHSYSALGIYDVTLVINGICGIDTLVQTINVDSAGIPDANFGWWPGDICPLQPVNFYTYTQGTSYFWDFEDGDTAVNQNPSHTFLSTGFYNVSLTITNGCGNSNTVSDSIEIKSNASFPPTVNMSVNNSPACPGEYVSMGADWGYKAYLWNAGDGSPADSTPYSNLNHTYADTGTYYPSVKIYSFCGGDTTISDTVIIGNNIPADTNLTLDYIDTLSCPEQSVRIQGPWGYKYYVYNYGDGSPVDSVLYSSIEHAYPDTGTFNVSVTVYNYCGLSFTIDSTLRIDDNAPFPGNMSIEFNNIQCPGDKVRFDISGGHEQYVWNYGDGSPLDTVIDGWGDHIYNATGTYPVQVTITSFCWLDTTLYDTITIANNVPISNNITLNANPNPVCPNDRANLTVNGEMFVSYTWNFGDGDNIATGSNNWMEHFYNDPGTYTVAVTVTNGCGLDSTITTAVVVDTNSPFPPQTWFNIDPAVSCPGDKVNFETEWGYPLYFWNFGDGDTITTTRGRIAHTYFADGAYLTSVTITNGCGNQITLNKSAVVDSNNTYVDPTIVTLNNTICPGDQITIAPEGDDGTSYTYAWNLGDGTIDTTYGIGINHVYSDTGTYTVTVIATNGCGYSASSSLTVYVLNNAPASLGQNEKYFGIAGDGDIAGCAGDAVLFYFAGVYANTWDFGDGSSASATDRIQLPFGYFSVITHAYADTGTYWAKLTITNACGNSLTDSIPVIIGSDLWVSADLFAEPPTAGASYTTCEGVNFLAMGGSSYNWNYGDGVTLNTSSSHTTHFYSTAGNYTVSVNITNACGNSEAISIAIDVIDGGGASVVASVNSTLTCNNGSNGSAIASAFGGTLPYAYIWNDPLSQTSATATGLSTGTYTVTVTDNNGCSGTGIVTLSNPAAITGTGTFIAANCGVADGSITITGITGGTSPYTYLWINGDNTSTADSLAAGAYPVTISDFNGCSNVQVFTLNDNGGIIITGTAANAACKGSSSGSINISVSGGTAPYNYLWSNGSTTQDITALIVGSYTVTVTDSNTCKSIQIFTVNEPSVISISSTIVKANCGVADGSISISGSGGTPPYTFSWSTGAIGPVVTNLVAGAYNVTVTDTNACTKPFTMLVSNANAPVITAVVSNISCNGLNDGVIDLSVTGGTTPYTYLWLHDGSFTQDINNLSPGSYTVILNDGGGCQSAQTNTIIEPGVLSVSISVTGAHCGYSDGSATATVSGGTSPFIYSWSSGGSGSAETGLSAGTYTLLVTDVKGCTVYDTIIVSTAVDEQPICIITVDSTSTKNVIVWEKPNPASGIDHFNIYRDIISVYTLVGSVPYSNFSEFIDTTNGVNPNTTSYMYKVSAVDSCGNESALSNFHKTIHLTPPDLIGGKVSLIWDNYQGFGFDFYRILRDSTGLGNWEAIDSVTNANFTYTDQTPPQVSDLNYNIEVVHTTGCTAEKAKNYNSSKSNTSSISNTAALTATASMTNASSTCDGTATVTAGGGTPPYTYSWNTIPPQAGQTATGLCAGNYSVTVTDTAGSTTTASVVVGTAPGISEYYLDKYVNIYPNPNSGIFQIDISLPEKEEVTIKIFDMRGCIISNEFVKPMSAYSGTVNLSQISPGIYQMLIVTSKGATVKKIVIN